MILPELEPVPDNYEQNLKKVPSEGESVGEVKSDYGISGDEFDCELSDDEQFRKGLEYITNGVRNLSLA